VRDVPRDLLVNQLNATLILLVHPGTTSAYWGIYQAGWVR
jgi:hypothetical protein